MNEELPDWVIKVQQLTAEIQANANDSKAKADEKRDILMAQARRMPMTEIGRLIGVSRERVSMILNRHTKVKAATDTSE